MKKLVILSICMVAVMMACTNKGKTASGDGVDSDSVVTDSMELVELGDTTPQPMFIYIQNPDNMMMLYGDSDSIENNFRRNRALYTKLLNNDNKCLGIKYIGEELNNPDGERASYGEIHGREDIPAAGLKYAFTDEKFNARNMGGMYVCVTDEYLATRKLINMTNVGSVKPLPREVVKKLEAQYKLKHQRSMLAKQGNKYSYGVMQFAGTYKTVKENGEKYQKALALEVILTPDAVYSFPVEGYIIDGQPTWNADDDGEYAPSMITLFEAPDSTLEIAFAKWAPESCTTGMYYVRNGEMTREQYECYQTMIDEQRPLWKKDLAQLQKLFDNYVGGHKHQLVKYRWIDIDEDEKDEIWLRAADDVNGALFKQVGGKWKLLGYEDRDKNSVMDILPEGVGIWWINVQE